MGGVHNFSLAQMRRLEPSFASSLNHSCVLGVGKLAGSAKTDPLSDSCVLGFQTSELVLLSGIPGKQRSK